MRIRRTATARSLIAVLAGSLAISGAAAAQDEPAGPTCALVTVDEVNEIFTGANLALNDWSGAWYCSFGGGFDLTMSLMPGTDLATVRTSYGGGGEDLTVAGRPGWWQEDSGNFAVAANGSVLFLNGWASATTAGEKLALLTALAELAIPRVPPGADPATAARLTALLPATIGDTPVTPSVVPGWYLMGIVDAERPEVRAFEELLATQGRTTADLVVAVGTGDPGEGVLLVEVPGFDGAALLVRFFSAFSPEASGAEVSTVDLGGKQVTRFALEPPAYAYASGGTAVYATGPDEFLAAFFGALP